MDHSELVQLAVQWLYKRKCGFVLSELGVFTGSYNESPDAIGFRKKGSILIEVKTSEIDFRKDKRKPFRSKASKGMGDYRFYMCPKGLIKAKQLPDKWGLLYVSSKGAVRKVVGAYSGDTWRHTKNIYNEHRLMYKALRRLELRHGVHDLINKTWKEHEGE
jgi:hypothetical protein